MMNSGEPDIPDGPVPLSSDEGTDLRMEAPTDQAAAAEPLVSDLVASEPLVSEPAVSEHLREKLSNLPTDPGVYQYRDREGKVIYVGKAKNLRNRVRSYFQGGRHRDAKTTALVRKIDDLEVIVTDSEVEALILEDNLIKRFRPRYNILLKDDKTYPYIRVTNEPYPRVFSTRRIVRDGSRYFGPYTDAKYIRYLLKTLRSIFPIRSCDLNLTDESIAEKRFNICLDYHIGKCEGPCEGFVSREHYGEMIRQVEYVLNGKTRTLERTLEQDMTNLAEAMRFEEAAVLRNRLQKLREYGGRQKVVTDDLVDRDVVAIASEDDDACAVIFRVRDGKLTGRQHYYMSGVLDMAPEAILDSFVGRHYASSDDIPPEIFLPIPLGDDFDVIQQCLNDKRRTGSVALVVPKIGDKQKLVAMAETNARFLLGELKLQRMKRSDMVPRPVQSLQRDLRLTNPPRRIECFDNSNFQGTDPVSSMVCFVDGRPRRSEYRKYKVRTVEGPDDFATMAEAVTRRYSRVMSEGLALPDLIVIDGGKGQVSAAVGSMKELGLEHIPLIGLAKRLEEIVIPNQKETILLPKSSSSLRLLQQVRDEAHRFAITFHRSLRQKRTLQTELTNIPGIGKKTAGRIFEKFGSVRGVSAVELEELQEVLGPKTGQAVFDYFQQQRSAESNDDVIDDTDEVAIDDIIDDTIDDANDDANDNEEEII